MPLIVIHNTNKDVRVATTNFVAGLKSVVAGISELGISEKDITVASGSESEDMNDQTLIVIVELLFDKPERTFEVRQRLAREIGLYITEGLRRFGRTRKVEVAVKKFNPEKDAFYAE